MVKKKDFLDLKEVTVFYNKKNGQMSISLPKKQMKEVTGMPKKIPNIRLWFGKGKK